MYELVMFMLSTVGLTLLIVDGTVLEWFRALIRRAAVAVRRPGLGEVVGCYLCTGTWSGFVMGAVWLGHDPLTILSSGCAGAFLSRAGATILNTLDAVTIRNLPEAS